ncbi:hypothetical protein LAZ67_1001722 [Cordylochernes scorpioides]|uniref:Reverse transcriptase domain-containing protein n=1 Tax=Cordylochernes scorpioides TaxID=51811 RepID=A0ABY6JYZ6_9ARAC|nr:hypothetical protein LAZ67_1001722 [Cordylochernes scorpioides]
MLRNRRREEVNDEERAGRPKTSTTDEKINEVEKMILANRRITFREVAEDLNISIGSCHSIFINDFGMRRVAAKFVPKLLNCDQKQHRMNIANEMLDSVRDDPNLLKRVITGDEAWVYGYDVKTKAQSSQWKLPHEPRPKKARQVRSNVKVLLTGFFDCRGVVHHEFLPQGRTVNKEYYLQIMRNLREAIRQKRPDLWKNKNWLLHHDNAPAHTSLLVRDSLAKNNTLMMPQPPYYPDLAPHIVEVCAKVRGMLPRLTAAVNLNFGFGYRALRTLYLQVVVPAIAYASAAEALGLVKALENATTLPNHLTLGFFLDNLSVVKSVLNSKTESSNSLVLYRFEYLQSEPEQGVLELPSQMVRNVRIENVLITGDFNARSLFLGDREDSTRGRNLEDLIISHGLEVWNNWGTSTFSTRNAKSSANPVSVERTPRYSVRGANIERFLKRFSTELENDLDLAVDGDGLDRAVDGLHLDIIATSRDLGPRTGIVLSFKRKKQPWWSDDLELLRKEDGTRIHDLSDTLSHILDVHFGVKHLECEDVLPSSGRMDPLFTEREVKRTAFKFGNRKSPGPDGIDNTIVKALVRRYGSLLTRLYNRCLELGRFPRAWKAARIALLEKSGKTGATAKDYRPVSLLSCLGKVLNSLLAQRLTKWLESGKNHSSSQHGFRKGWSTTSCLEGILGKIEEGVAKGNWVIAISFDIAGAFYNLNWNMVVSALDEKGCPFNLLTLIRDFLRDRRVSIKVGAVDMHRIVSKGCPQGPCCSHILWNVVADTILRKELPAGACMVAYAEALANESIGRLKC